MKPYENSNEKKPNKLPHKFKPNYTLINTNNNNNNKLNKNGNYLISEVLKENINESYLNSLKTVNTNNYTIDNLQNLDIEIYKKHKKDFEGIIFILEDILKLKNIKQQIILLVLNDLKKLIEENFLKFIKDNNLNNLFKSNETDFNKNNLFSKLIINLKLINEMFNDYNFKKLIIIILVNCSVYNKGVWASECLSLLNELIKEEEILYTYNNNNNKDLKTINYNEKTIEARKNYIKTKIIKEISKTYKLFFNKVLITECDNILKNIFYILQPNKEFNILLDVLLSCIFKCIFPITSFKDLNILLYKSIKVIYSSQLYLSNYSIKAYNYNKLKSANDINELKLKTAQELTMLLKQQYCYEFIINLFNHNNFYLNKILNLLDLNSLNFINNQYKDSINMNSISNNSLVSIIYSSLFLTNLIFFKNSLCNNNIIFLSYLLKINTLFFDITNKGSIKKLIKSNYEYSDNLNEINYNNNCNIIYDNLNKVNYINNRYIEICDSLLNIINLLFKLVFLNNEFNAEDELNKYLIIINPSYNHNDKNQFDIFKYSTKDRIERIIKTNNYSIYKNVSILSKDYKNIYFMDVLYDLIIDLLDNKNRIINNNTKPNAIFLNYLNIINSNLSIMIKLYSNLFIITFEIKFYKELLDKIKNHYKDSIILNNNIYNLSLKNNNTNNFQLSKLIFIIEKCFKHKKDVKFKITNNAEDEKNINVIESNDYPEANIIEAANQIIILLLNNFYVLNNIENDSEDKYIENISDFTICCNKVMFINFDLIDFNTMIAKNVNKYSNMFIDNNEFIDLNNLNKSYIHIKNISVINLYKSIVTIILIISNLLSDEYLNSANRCYFERKFLLDEAKQFSKFNFYFYKKINELYKNIDFIQINSNLIKLISLDNVSIKEIVLNAILNISTFNNKFSDLLKILEMIENNNWEFTEIEEKIAHLLIVVVKNCSKYIHNFKDEDITKKGKLNSKNIASVLKYTKNAKNISNNNSELNIHKITIEKIIIKSLSIALKMLNQYSKLISNNEIESSLKLEIKINEEYGIDLLNISNQINLLQDINNSIYSSSNNINSSIYNKLKTGNITSKLSFILNCLNIFYINIFDNFICKQFYNETNNQKLMIDSIKSLDLNFSKISIKNNSISYPIYYYDYYFTSWDYNKIINILLNKNSKSYIKPFSITGIRVLKIMSIINCNNYTKQIQFINKNIYNILRDSVDKSKSKIYNLSIYNSLYLINNILKIEYLKDFENIAKCNFFEIDLNIFDFIKSCSKEDINNNKFNTEFVVYFEVILDWLFYNNENISSSNLNDLHVLKDNNFNNSYTKYDPNYTNKKNIMPLLLNLTKSNKLTNVLSNNKELLSNKTDIFTKNIYLELKKKMFLNVNIDNNMLLNGNLDNTKKNNNVDKLYCYIKDDNTIKSMDFNNYVIRSIVVSYYLKVIYNCIIHVLFTYKDVILNKKVNNYLINLININIFNNNDLEKCYKFYNDLRKKIISHSVLVKLISIFDISKYNLMNIHNKSLFIIMFAFEGIYKYIDNDSNNNKNNNMILIKLKEIEDIVVVILYYFYKIILINQTDYQKKSNDLEYMYNKKFIFYENFFNVLTKCINIFNINLNLIKLEEFLIINTDNSLETEYNNIENKYNNYLKCMYTSNLTCSLFDKFKNLLQIQHDTVNYIRENYLGYINSNFKEIKEYMYNNNVELVKELIINYMLLHNTNTINALKELNKEKLSKTYNIEINNLIKEFRLNLFMRIFNLIILYEQKKNNCYIYVSEVLINKFINKNSFKNLIKTNNNYIYIVLINRNSIEFYRFYHRVLFLDISNLYDIIFSEDLNNFDISKLVAFKNKHFENINNFTININSIKYLIFSILCYNKIQMYTNDYFIELINELAFKSWLFYYYLLLIRIDIGIFYFDYKFYSDIYLCQKDINVNKLLDIVYKKSNSLYTSSMYLRSSLMNHYNKILKQNNINKDKFFRELSKENLNNIMNIIDYYPINIFNFKYINQNTNTLFNFFGLGSNTQELNNLTGILNLNMYHNEYHLELYVYEEDYNIIDMSEIDYYICKKNEKELNESNSNINENNIDNKNKEYFKLIKIINFYHLLDIQFDSELYISNIILKEKFNNYIENDDYLDYNKFEDYKIDYVYDKSFKLKFFSYDNFYNFKIFIIHYSNYLNSINNLHEYDNTEDQTI